MKHLIFKLLVLGLLAASPLMFSVEKEEVTNSTSEIQYMVSDEYANGGG